MVKKGKVVLLGLAIVSLIFIATYLLTGYIYDRKESAIKGNTTGEETIGEDNTGQEEENEGDPVVPEEESIDKKVESFISNMTLEEKIGQLFIIKLEAINDGVDCTSFTSIMETNLETYNVGGVIFFQKNIIDRDQVSTLIKEIQNNRKVPLFISVDEEGGTVARLGDTPSMGVTQFEDMINVGNNEDYDRAFEIGSTIGKEIHELGFNLDFAPVADVLTNPNNYEIGVRSFSSDPNIVSGMVQKVVEGLQNNNVSATLKHFPGHGDSENNSHEQTIYTLKTLDEMRQVEFLPFKAGIEKDVDLIMVSHISAPNVTGSDIPSSLSPVIIIDILRNELEYENIITTDALDMGAVSQNYYPGEAAINALEAGADILLMTPDFQEVYNEVLNAVNSGVISEDRINESVSRILKVKLKRGISMF